MCAHIFDWPKGYNIIKNMRPTGVDFELAKGYYIIDQTYVHIMNCPMFKI